MPCEGITIRISIPAAKAMMIYGIQLGEMNEKCEPEVSEGLNRMAQNIWRELTLQGKIDELNQFIAEKYFPGATGIVFKPNDA